MLIALTSVLVFGSYLLSIFLISSIKKCSTKDATAKLNRFLRDIFRAIFCSTPQITFFPTMVGWDGCRVLPQLVDDEFQKVSDNFAACYCSDVSFSLEPHVVQYRFEIQRKPDSVEDEILIQLIQKEAEETVTHTMRRYDCYIPAEPLTYVELCPNYLRIAFARTEEGIRILDEQKKKVRKRQQLSAPPVPMKEKWQNSITHEMVWGYQRDSYCQYEMKIPISTDISAYLHMLLTGASGSGKSISMIFLIGKLLQAYPDIVIFVCDFKNSMDFSFLEGYLHYYTGADCYQGIMAYYKKFSEIRADRTKQGETRYLLICDEYPAFVNYLQMKDKNEKTKLANDILSAIAEILMLGRGIAMGIWIITQRADASLFANGARDNFMVVIGLGRMSKEQKTMLFSGQELPEETFGVGEGLLLADGKELVAVKYPIIVNIDNWKDHIFRIVNASWDKGSME